MQNKTSIKFAFLFSLLLFSSCIIEEKKESIEKSSEVLLTAKYESENSDELRFIQTQDSLRNVLIKSKPNKILNESLLQELYIRGLVIQEGQKFKFDLPFNLHGADCGAPDCFTTNISFEIPASSPLQFPKNIQFVKHEFGCGVEKESQEKGNFELVEKSGDYINYYSKDHHSNLVYLGEERQLYYFPETKSKSIRIGALAHFFENYDEDKSSILFPYQSTSVTTNEYEHFIR